MSNFPSIFNTTFFVILGIIIIAIGLLVIYFENKMREQNHKISSMLSLVSSLADELNAVKFHLNHMNMVGSGMKDTVNTINIPINSSETINLGENLINVSDNEDEDDGNDYDDNDADDDNDDDDNDDDDDDDNDDDDDDDNDDDDDDDDDDTDNEDIINKLLENKLNENDIRVLNINDLNSKNQNKNDETTEEDSDDDRDDDDDDDENDSDNEEFDMIETFDIEDIDSIVEDDKKLIDIEVVDINKNIELDDMNDKSILINLEKTKNTEVIDYKKLSLNKLKSVVLDKGLTTDTSKMKKNDLLKLLGIE